MDVIKILKIWQVILAFITTHLEKEADAHDLRNYMICIWK